MERYYGGRNCPFPQQALCFPLQALSLGLRRQQSLRWEAAGGMSLGSHTAVTQSLMAEEGLQVVGRDGPLWLSHNSPQKVSALWLQLGLAPPQSTTPPAQGRACHGAVLSLSLNPFWCTGYNTSLQSRYLHGTPRQSCCQETRTDNAFKYSTTRTGERGKLFWCVLTSLISEISHSVLHRAQQHRQSVHASSLLGCAIASEIKALPFVPAAQPAHHLYLVTAPGSC